VVAHVLLSSLGDLSIYFGLVVHAGMLSGAMGILDDYFIRPALHRLFLELNYSISFVGHSLGAGTAALLAAEFRNGLQLLLSEKFILEGCPKISALAVSCPACVSETLSDAFAEDDLVLSVINGYDIVPRFSKVNMAKMLLEIKANGDKVDSW
jgi:pimeloyl-ACP methyl ester carboxylesterase